jgi:hypothetical protein
MVARLCGLVDRVSGYRSRGPGFCYRRCHIFAEIVGQERGPLSLMRITRSCLNGKVAAPVYKPEINGCWDLAVTKRHPLPPNVGSKVADMRRMLGRYGSLAN